MIFSSVTFLFMFLPVVAVLHLVIPSRTAKNLFLIAASLFFYAWGEGLNTVLMLASVFANWIFGLITGKAKNGRRANAAVAAAVIFNIGMLAAFKYAGFFASLINCLPFANIPLPSSRLPIGISFYTFQALSYVIDVRRDRRTMQKKFLSVLLYITLFPQLIAGPVVKYHEIAESINSRRVSADSMASGIRRFIIGLSKKMLIADILAVPVDALFSAESVSAAGAWTAVLFYCFQIYFDFGGYSDMASGLGEMLGFRFPENFDYPYSSANIGEFWRRWHISLSSWFREYLYIPLGGNRRGKFRTCLNLLIVFAATGLWHGAGLTFLVWGLYHGILVVLEKLNIIKFKHKILGRIYTLLAVMFGFVPFRADSLPAAFRFLCSMFGASGTDAGDVLPYLTPVVIFTAAVAAVISFPVLPAIKRKITTGKAYAAARAISYPAVFMLFALCVMLLAANSYSPFIYFRF